MNTLIPMRPEMASNTVDVYISSISDHKKVAIMLPSDFYPASWSPIVDKVGGILILRRDDETGSPAGYNTNNPKRCRLVFDRRRLGLSKGTLKRELQKLTLPGTVMVKDGKAQEIIIPVEALKYDDTRVLSRAELDSERVRKAGKSRNKYKARAVKPWKSSLEKARAARAQKRAERVQAKLGANIADLSGSQDLGSGAFLSEGRACLVITGPADKISALKELIRGHGDIRSHLV